MSNPIIIPPQNIARSELQKAIRITRAFGQDNITSLIYQAGMPSEAAPKDNRDLGVSKMLGNIVMSNLQIEGDRYNTLTGDVSFQTLTFDTVLFNVSGAKNIVETNIQGKQGSVFEYISMANYSVQIRGVITAPYGVYPGKQTAYNQQNNVDSLKAALEAPQALRVNSWYLQQFNIFRLVVMSYEFPQNEGQYSVQPFLIEAKSDYDFIVNLK